MLFVRENGTLLRNCFLLYCYDIDKTLFDEFLPYSLPGSVAVDVLFVHFYPTAINIDKILPFSIFILISLTLSLFLFLMFYVIKLCYAKETTQNPYLNSGFGLLVICAKLWSHLIISFGWRWNVEQSL